MSSPVPGFLAANAIFVDSDGHVYIGGRNSSNNAIISVDGVISTLPDGHGVNQITQKDGHVYVLGYGGQNFASMIWTDGVSHPLTTLSKGNGLASDANGIYIAGNALNNAGLAIDKNGTVTLLNQNGNFVNAMAVNGGHTYVVGGDLNSTPALWTDGSISSLTGFIAVAAVAVDDSHIYIGGRNSANHAAIAIDGVGTELNANGGAINSLSVYVH